MCVHALWIGGIRTLGYPLAWIYFPLFLLQFFRKSFGEKIRLTRRQQQQDRCMYLYACAFPFAGHFRIYEYKHTFVFVVLIHYSLVVGFSVVVYFNTYIPIWNSSEREKKEMYGFYASFSRLFQLDGKTHQWNELHKHTNSRLFESRFHTHKHT